MLTSDGARVLEEELKVLTSDGARILEEELKMLTSDKVRTLEDELKMLKYKNEDSYDIEKAREQIENLNMELKTWESFKTLKIPNVVIIDIPPTQPIKAKAAQIVFIAMIAGLILGVLIAVMRDAMRSLRKRENLFALEKRDSKFVY